MLFDAMVMSAVVLVIFFVFAGVVAWADYQTRPERLKKADISQVAPPCRAMAAPSRSSSLSVESSRLRSSRERKSFAGTEVSQTFDPAQRPLIRPASIMRKMPPATGEP
jgi:hypothetical protein